MGTRPLVKTLILCLFLWGACKTKEPPKEEPIVSETVIQEVYICPMECENGMNYYMEGKCDICHINLIQKEKP